MACLGITRSFSASGFAAGLVAFTPLMMHWSVARAQTAPAPEAVAPTVLPPGAPSAPSTPEAELSVQLDDQQGTIFVDGSEVGRGSYRGKLRPGRHQLRVLRPGYEPFERWIDLEPGQVRSESVSLQQSVSDAIPEAAAASGRSHDGIYAGVRLLGAVQPGGAGTTFDDACDTTGAASCATDTPLGAGLSGYIGWLFEPLGLELALLGSAHVDRPSAAFDGDRGSEINPVVAAPERNERFTIGRFGGGAAIRGRLWHAISGVRFTLAAGPGFVYRTVAFRRETDAADGFSSRTAESGIDYVSPLLSLELGAEIELSRSLGFSVGVLSWVEHAGDNAKSAARNDTTLFLDEDTRPLPQATPAYDLANGPQWFIGPYLGVAFGP